MMLSRENSAGKSNSNITFHNTGIDDARVLIDFHNSYYHTSRTVDQWIWEHKTCNPEKAVFTYACDGDLVIGTQAMLPIEMRIGRETVLTGKSESTLISPVYRGTGVINRLYEYAVDTCIQKGMQFIWGFTEAVHAFQRFGFNVYAGPELFVKINSPVNQFLHLLKYNPKLFLQADNLGKIRKTAHLLLFSKKPEHRVSSNSLAEYKVKEDKTNINDLNWLYDKLASRYPDTIFLNYNEQFFSWRIWHHPFIQYNELQVYVGSDLVGNAVVATHNNSATISSLAAVDPGATSVLLDAIINRFGGKVIRLQYFGNLDDKVSDNVIKQLVNYGFSSYGSSHLVVRDLSAGSYPQIHDICSWQVNGLFTEGFDM